MKHLVATLTLVATLALASTATAEECRLTSGEILATALDAGKDILNRANGAQAEGMMTVYNNVAPVTYYVADEVIILTGGTEALAVFLYNDCVVVTSLPIPVSTMIEVWENIATQISRTSI